MKKALAAVLLLASASARAADVDVKELVDRANKALRGDSSHDRVTMTVETPEWSRTLDVEGWNKSRTFAFIVIRAPAKEKGETTLRRNNEMWLWMPKVERVVKIPPTMMHSAWQGSDFTYEDIVKADSVVKDYDHTLLSKRREDGRTVYHIQGIPKPDAPVVWGKVISDVALRADPHHHPLRREDPGRPARAVPPGVRADRQERTADDPDLPRPPVRRVDARRLLQLSAPPKGRQLTC